MDVSGKTITHLDDIKYFTGLITLDLSNTSISTITASNITALSGLTKLKTLGLRNNTNSDLNAFTNLTNSNLITTGGSLDLSGNIDITNWIPVAHIDDVTGRPEKLFG